MGRSLAVLILAAGMSKRLKEPKQLLVYEKKSLLYDACQKALLVNKNVFVVLGANYERCHAEIKNLEVTVIKNEHYAKGLSSSIKKGIETLHEYEKVLILLCDQPFIPSSHLKSLVQVSQRSEYIVTSFYHNGVGVPAIFPQKYFPHLSGLSEDKGAKSIIKKNFHEKVLLDDKLAIDIDIPADKKYLNNGMCHEQ